MSSTPPGGTRNLAGSRQAGPVQPRHAAMELAANILDKRFELYAWCEQKAATLATVNSILLLGLVPLAGDNFDIDTWTRRVLFGAATLPIVLSTALVLWHIDPLMRSGRIPSTERNLRSVHGVEKFVSNDDYYDSIANATDAEILRSATNQIRGMNRNIIRNQKAIKIAVKLDLVGLLFAVMVVACSSFKVV